MNAKELETSFWSEAAHRFAHPEGNFLVDGYAPPGGSVADFTLVWHEGVIHLFHIERRSGGNCAWPGHEIYFGHSSTPDFQTWHRHEPVMLIRPGTWEGAHVYAPFVLPHDGRFYMFYTGLDAKNSQRIGVATSTDLFGWERYERNPILPIGSPEWAFWSPDEACSCRDPHVLRIGDTFHLYYTAVTAAGDGCVACATSDDLSNWTDCGPVCTLRQDLPALGLGSNHLESAAVHEYEGGYLLLYNHMGGVRVNRSRDPLHFDDTAGPFVWPGVNGIELVKRKGPEWLVAAFDRHERLRLGTIDWGQAAPIAHLVEDPSVLRRFLQ